MLSDEDIIEKYRDINFAGAFSGARNFNQPLTFDITNVDILLCIFDGATSFDQKNMQFNRKI